jgi:hypothetical protein
MASMRSVTGVCVLLAACGGDGDRTGADGESGSGGVLSITTDPGSDDGSTAASAEGNGPAGSATADETGVDPLKFDIRFPDVSTACGGVGGGGGGTADFSYIWVANSTEGTVSKINTQTLVEEGRYIVRADGIGSPSRTSVNLNGDMAVANRSSGVTKIYARPEDCPDPANTSTGGGDIKAWQDGCIAWFTPFNYASQRPVAWTQGEFDEATCRYENTKLWTSGANASIDVILIDGETGVVEQTIPIPGVAASYYGIYGAAVDSEGNFWGSQLGLGSLVRVKLSDFSVSVWPMNQSGYGMTVDSKGRPWTCSSALARFDPVTETWAANTTAGASGGGCMVDAAGILWVGGYDANFAYNLVGIDAETLALSQTIPLPNYAKGISIDFEGNVWAVSYAADAYRVDPASGQIDTFTGLVGPYTYSDMTGFALSQAGGPAG